MTDSEATAMAEAIKNMEPVLRARGQAPDWTRFRQQFHMGMYSEELLLKEAVDNSAGIKLNWFEKEKEQ
jgi:hypothetical protein